jgi:hypothetical protein
MNPVKVIVASGNVENELKFVYLHEAPNLNHYFNSPQMNMRNCRLCIFVLFSLVLISSECYSQMWMWADKIGLDTGGNDYGMAMTRDKQGHVLITGRVKGNSTFGKGTGAVTLIGFGDRDAYISKYDSLGNFIWARRYGGLMSDWGLGIGTDGNSNIYLTGYFTDSIKFGSTEVVGAGGQDVFLAKVDSSGNLLWVKDFGGTTNEYANALTVDAVGNSYITGTFTGTVTFGPNTLVCSGGIDYFIAKFDPNGNCVWAREAGNTLNDEGKSITLNSSGTSVYVCGYYNGNVTFGSTALAGYSGNDIFVAKYDTSGTCTWAKRAGSSNHEFASAVALDKTGDLYITGNYVAAVNFGTTTSPVMIPAATGGQDIFLAKYDTLGNILWAKKAAGGSGTDNSQGIAVNQFNNPVFCGFFETTCDFGGISKTVEGGSRDVFVTEYDNSGNIVWLKTYKGVMKSGIYASGHAVVVDNTQHTYLTGGFLDTVAFDTITLISSGISSDVFLGKLSPYEKASFNASAIQVCVGGAIYFSDNSRGLPLTYQWTFEGATTPNSTLANPVVYYDSAGVFDVQLIINNGIESDTLFLNNYITVNAAPTVNIGSDTLACIGSTFVINAGTGFSSYLWQDGSTANSYNATVSGQYYVRVTDVNTCSAADTMNITFDLCTGADELSDGIDVEFFPNPVGSSGVLYAIINDIEKYHSLSLHIFDMTGRSVLNIKTITERETSIDTRNLAKGVYQITIETEDGRLARKKMVIN